MDAVWFQLLTMWLHAVVTYEKTASSGITMDE